MNQARTSRSRIAVSLAVVALLALAWWGWSRFPPGAPGPGGEPVPAGGDVLQEVYYGPPGSLAVLPFTGAGAGADGTVLSEGLASTILDLLVADARLQVTARSSSFFFRDRGSGYRLALTASVGRLDAGRSEVRDVLAALPGSGPSSPSAIQG